MASSSTLSQNATHGKSTDEEDLHERSTKKVKDHNLHDMEGVRTSDTIEGEADIALNGETNANEKSYKGAVVGVEMVDGEVEMDGSDSDDDTENTIEIDIEGIRVEEQKIGNYDCPIFVLSKSEEKRIHRPWKRGVIVKLLGRRIGYKALETRLKQMWVKKGIINIIDLGNDYYLVTFSHEFDHETALLNGPWFIYDHYLTVKEWSPDFHPQSDTIKNVAVWVRISGLPIEYYDAKVLKTIGNKIGSTVKVDKNTLMQERGKYARICVEVDLTKSLLAMFMIKGRKYNVEYEGLHLLCKTCGKFGHYSDGCPEKGKIGEVQRESSEHGGQKNGEVELAGSRVEGPWMVVQKQKRNRKAKEKETMVNTAVEGGGKRTPAKMNANGSINGSRFGALMDDHEQVMHEVSNHEENSNAAIRGRHVAEGRENGKGKKAKNDDTIIAHNKGNVEKGMSQPVIIVDQDAGIVMSENEGNEMMGCHLRAANQEKNIKGAKLGARVTGIKKGRTTSKKRELRYMKIRLVGIGNSRVLMFNLMIAKSDKKLYIN
ncbi:zinc ion binding / nucleic acid binding protein [Trifolium repens]|nr:zinc ion binding / nucleic acid binding protein [Trifolium repens]